MKQDDPFGFAAVAPSPKVQAGADPFGFASDAGARTAAPAPDPFGFGAEPRGFWESMKREGFSGTMPFAGLFGDTLEDKLDEAMKRVESGNYTDEDKALILSEHKWRQRPQGAAGIAGGLIPNSLQLGGEMLATGGMLGLAAKLPKVAKGAQALQAAAGGTTAGRLALAVAKLTGRAGAQVMAAEQVPKLTGGTGQATRAAMRETQEGFWEGLQVTPEDALVFDGSVEDFSAALPERTRALFWEYVAEQGIPGGKLLRHFQRSILGPLVGKGGKAAGAVKKILDGAQWQGVLAEIAEEYYSRVLQAADPELKEQWGDVIPPTDVILGEALGIAILGGGIGGVSSLAAKAAPQESPAAVPDGAETSGGDTKSTQAAGVSQEPGPEASADADGVAAPTGPGSSSEENPGKLAPPADDSAHQKGLPEALTKRFGDLEEVEPSTPSQNIMVATAERLGTNLRFVRQITEKPPSEGQEGTSEVREPAGSPGEPSSEPFIGASLAPGEVFVDANSERPEEVVWHELTHDFARRVDGGIETLASDLERIDAEGLQAARAAYRESFGAERFDALTEGLQGEEAVAQRAQELTAYLEYLATPEGRSSIERLAAEPTLLQRLVEAIREIGRKLGIGSGTRLEELSRKLGVEASVTDAKSAQAIHAALMSLADAPVVSSYQSGSSQLPAGNSQLPKPPVGDVKASESIPEGFVSTTRSDVPAAKPAEPAPAPKPVQTGRAGVGDRVVVTSRARGGLGGEGVVKDVTGSGANIRYRVEMDSKPIGPRSADTDLVKEKKGAGRIQVVPASELRVVSRGKRGPKQEERQKRAEREAESGAPPRFAAKKGAKSFRRADLFAQIDAPSEGFTDRVRRVFQAKHLPMRRFQELIVNEMGGTITEDTDFYAAAKRIMGKAEEKYRQLKVKYLDPINAEMRKLEGDRAKNLDAVGEFLHARTAEDVNSVLMQREPKKGWNQDSKPGSGMSKKKADAILAKHKGNATYQRIAVLFDGMSKMRQDVREESGLISKKTRQLWDTLYPHYAPLRDDEGEGAFRPARGAGFSVTDAESKQRKGRTRTPDNPLVFGVVNTVSAIMRAEKNNVGRTFYDFIQANPVAMRGVEKDESPDREPPAHAFRLWIDGEPQLIRVHDRLAQSMKNLGMAETGELTNASRKVTRVLASLNTSFNPAFTIPNLVRDSLTAYVSMSGDKNATGLRMKVLASIPAAGKATWDVLSGKDIKSPTVWHKAVQSFLDNGGKVGWVPALDFKATRKQFEKEMRSGPGPRAVRAFLEVAENINAAVENAVRVSYYHHLTEANIDPKRAAVMSRDLTVDFNEHGEFGPFINSWYMFANAGVQGSKTVGKVLRQPKAWAVLGGIMATGVINDMLLSMMSPEDDDGLSVYDKIPEFEKQRNLILWLGEDGDMVKLPLPYGFNVFPNIGRLVSEVSRGAKTSDQAAVELMISMAEAFNPIGGAQDPRQLVAPTVLDPFVDVSINKNFAGNPIAPSKMPGEQRADSQRAFRSVSPWAAKLAPWLNSVTGGDAVVSGAVDLSPETLEHFYGFATGGLGKLTSRVGVILTDPRPELFPNDTPILRRFYAELPDWSTQQVFYAFADEAEKRDAQIEHLREAGHTNTANRLRRRYGALANMVPQLRKMRREMSKLRKQADATDNEERKKAVARRIEQRMKNMTRKMSKAWERVGRGLQPREGLPWFD